MCAIRKIIQKNQVRVDTAVLINMYEKLMLSLSTTHTAHEKAIYYLLPADVIAANCDPILS